ncbi:MAG: DNRLRE domain-containing protein [bacterium]
MIRIYTSVVFCLILLAGVVVAQNEKETAAGSNLSRSSNLSLNTAIFIPSDDSFVRSNRPTRIYGHSDELRVRRSSSADYNAYLKFNVTGIIGTVQRAVLKLFVIDASIEGGEVYSVSNSYLGTNIPWDEVNLIYDNAPALAGNPLSALSTVNTGEVVEFDVTTAVSSDGVVSFALSNSTSDLANFSSKEGVQPPALLIEFDSGVNPIPNITDFSPKSGLIGSEVTVTGSQFVGVTQVRFNGTPAAQFVVDSPTQLRATVPVGATTGRISVINPAGTTTSVTDFEVTAPLGNLIFPPTDDAYVHSRYPTRNHASALELRVRQASAVQHSYLKFQVSGLAGPPQRAMLRLFVSNASEDGGAVYSVSNNYIDSSQPWLETGLVFENAPAIGGSPLNRVAAVNLNEVVEFDVTAAINGDGVYSFALANASSDLANYYSKESAHAPELVVETGSPAPAIPNVSSFTPLNGPVGTEVTIAGRNFVDVSSVWLNGLLVDEFTLDSSSQLRLRIPGGASSGIFKVANPIGSDESADIFTVIYPPTVASFQPERGSPGTEVTIVGSNFSYISAVTFNGVPSSNFDIDSDSQLRAIVPGLASSGAIELRNPAGSANSSAVFTVNATAGAHTFTPIDDAFVRSARPNNNYSSHTDLRVRQPHSDFVNSYLKFDLSGLSGTVLKATIRLLAVEGGVDGGAIYAVSNEFNAGDLPWNEENLLYANAPSIAGPPLSTLDAVAVNETVEFDVTAAVAGAGVYSFAIQNNANDLVGYSSKEGAQAPQLVIESSGGSDPVPTILSFSPVEGVAGTRVTIIGSQFSQVTEVSFGGISSNEFAVDSSTQLRTRVPEGAVTGKISVVAAEATVVSEKDFVVIKLPSISSFTPTAGAPGTEVTITGRHFVSDLQVEFGGRPAAAFVTDSENQIRAQVPADATSGLVTVRNLAGSAASTDSFKVTASSESLTLTPVQDTFVRSNRPTRIYGGTYELRVRRSSSADFNTYLKFNVAGFSGVVRRAVLRLFVLDASFDGGEVYSVSNHYSGTSTPWDEDNLNYENAPPLTGNPLSAVAAVAAGEVVEFDVTAAVNGNGVYSFAVSSSNSDLANYSSKEGVQAPELFLSTAVASSKTPTISGFFPPSGNVGTEVTITGSHFLSDQSGGSHFTGTIRIMPLGNSITQGVHGSTDNAGYRNDLAELLGSRGVAYDFVGTKRDGAGFDRHHEGHSGFRADELLAQLQNYLTQNSPQMILLHIGTNDISELQTPESTVDEIGQVLDTIKLFDAEIVTLLASVIPRTDSKDAKTTTLNNLIRNLVSDKQSTGHKLRYVAMNEAFRDQANWETAYMDDRVHPNDTGYAVMAGIWFDEIMNVLSGSGGVTVAFNGQNASTVFVDSSTHIRAVVPAGASSGKISVTTDFGTGLSQTDFTILSAPTLKLTLPAGGEKWQGGSTHTIAWQSTVSIEHVRLDFSPDEGKSWLPIAAKTANDGKFIWNLPEKLTGQCQVRIADADGLAGMPDKSPVFYLGKEEIQSSLPNLADLKRAAFDLVDHDSHILKRGDRDQDGDVDIFDIIHVIDHSSEPMTKERLAKGSEPISASTVHVKLDWPLHKPAEIKLVSLPVSINSEEPIRGFQLQIKFDRQRVELMEPLQIESVHNMLMNTHVKENTVELLGYLKKEHSAVEIKGALFELPLRILNEELLAEAVQISEARFASKDNQPLPVRGVEESAQASPIPLEFQLQQNYPNPFNLSTRIDFTLPAKSKVLLQIFNLKGQKVRTLLKQEKPAGQHKITWDGRDDRGLIAASGVYVYRLQAGKLKKTKMMTLIK